MRLRVMISLCIGLVGSGALAHAGETTRVSVNSAGEQGKASSGNK